MNRPVNIGIIQFESELGAVEKNIRKSIKMIEEAASKEADIVCLPELFATGYDLDVLKEEVVKLSIKYNNLIIDSIAKAARENKVYVLAPFGEVRDISSVVYNSAVLFDDNGNKVGSYAKTHLHEMDKPYFKAGSELPVFDTKYGRIGILICYDLAFPEPSRSLCLDGAEIIIAPAAWGVEFYARWRAQLSHRALENVLFTVGVNRVGDKEGMHFFGKSMVCDPNGQVLAVLPEDEELVDVVAIDLDDVRKYRIETTFLQDRRPQIYGNITNPDKVNA